MTEPVVMHDIDLRGVATITLNRPEVNNAYNGELIDGVNKAFTSLTANSSVRVIMLRGNGRHFQAGADLAWINKVSEQSDEANQAVSQATAALVRDLNECPLPTVALIHGACVGGGTGIASACDVVIASEDAMFAISEARWGLAAHIIFPQLNAAIGARQVRRYALTCERFDADEARRIGLAHIVCPTGQLDTAAAPVIDGLLKAAPEALADTKQSVMQCANDLMDDQTFDALVRRHSDKRRTAEAAEGTASFIEKRDPSWYPG